MSFGVKPTFGVAAPILKTNSRIESGAVWKRLSKKDSSEFLSIKISLSKDKLKELLNQANDTVDIGFVAFPNSTKNDNPARPDFRIFEDTPKRD